MILIKIVPLISDLGKTPLSVPSIFKGVLDLDHTTMRCKYLQCTPIKTFLYYLVPFLVKKNDYKLKNKHIFCTSHIFSVQTRVSYFK